MTTLKETAQGYEPSNIHNVAELDKVSVDIEIKDDEFEVTDDKTGEVKTVKQKIAIIDGKNYRVPNSVLNQLKGLLEDNPDLKLFKVKKTGAGLSTEYQVIPINKP